jgi:hypothetical protein
MTYQEYINKKNELESCIRKLEGEWNLNKKDDYANNVGKYYKSSNGLEFGRITSMGGNRPEYLCKEISKETSGGFYYSTMEEYDVTYFLRNMSWITEGEFNHILNMTIDNVKCEFVGGC